MKYCYLDAEFNGISEQDLNVVSIASVQVEDGVVMGESKFWTHGKNYHDASIFYSTLVAQGYTFVSFVVEAEVRTLKTVAPHIDWVAVPWIDLYLEYRCLLNHNHELAYGKQFIKGKVITTHPPVSKWDRTEEDNQAHHTPSFSLAAATFKLLDKMIDTDEKTRMRDIIIASDPVVIEAHKDEVLKYNLSDIENLRALSQAIVQKFHDLGVMFADPWLKAALLRGQYAALTAYMISRGYPVNMSKITKLQSNVVEILETAKEACNAFGFEAFKLNKKSGQFSRVNSAIKNWIKAQNHPTWMKTDSGDISLSSDAFEDYYNSDSPGFAGAFCRLLKTMQSLNGFSPGSKHKFMDFVGADGRVRPHFGIYGAQSSRSQPKAAAFIPLKAHWMRTMIEPTGNKALVGIDYSSQEFLLAAILSNDETMKKDYATGDVYLAFARIAGLVPPEATKKTHKRERDICKSCVLGMSYAMGAKGLAYKMTADTGVLVTQETAQSYIDLFSAEYPAYAAWKEGIQEEYKEDGVLELSDGWYMWGDNDNWRSVINMPIQGTGAVIMRRAVFLCHQRNIPIVFTLHDALYAEIEYSNLSKMRQFRDTMIEAYNDVMKPYGDIPKMLVEGMAWSKHYAEFKVDKIDEIELLPSYWDDKCKVGLSLFSKYLN